MYHELDQLNENDSSFESIKQVEKSIEDIENVLGDLHKKSITLFRQGDKIKYQILYLYPPVKESESIDLRYLPDSPYYYIYLHKTDTIIGNIIILIMFLAILDVLLKKNIVAIIIPIKP